MRAFLIRYQACIVLLHEWGERAWPWNVHFVWGYVATGPECYECGSNPHKLGCRIADREL